MLQFETTIRRPALEPPECISTKLCTVPDPLLESLPAVIQLSRFLCQCPTVKASGGTGEVNNHMLRVVVTSQHSRGDRIDV